MKMHITSKNYQKASKEIRAIINYLMDEGLAEEGWRIEINWGDFYPVSADGQNGAVAVYKKGCRNVTNVYEIYLDITRRRVEWKDARGHYYMATGNDNEYRGDLMRAASC